MPIYLSVDIGASSGRHIVSWSENGKFRQKEVYRFANGPEKNAEGLVWNARRLEREVKTGLKRAGDMGLMPDYVGIDTWGVDYALLDSEKRLIGDIFCYRSDRTAPAITALHERIPFAGLYARTGIQFQPFNTLYQLYADKLSGKLDRAAYFLMLPDYLNFTLTGVMRQEYTNASTAGMVSALTHTWDEEILRAADLPKALFTPLTQPGSVVGRFSPETECEVGYNATVLLPATHDTASAVFALPEDSDAPYISSGTWSLLGLREKTAHTGESAMTANWSNEGGPDFTFRYQKNIMGLWMLQNIRKELSKEWGKDVTFPQMAEMAESVSAGPTVDVNHPDFLAPVSMMDAVRAHAPACTDTPRLLRCVYDSLAKSYQTALCELEAHTGRQFPAIHIIGGGCRDTFLNRLTEQATGKKVMAGPVEATALGNLFMQIKAVGDADELKNARESLIEYS